MTAAQKVVVAKDDNAADAATEVTGTVARGRTVHVGKERKRPGDEVTLPAAEIASLIRRGFLVDPDAEAVKEANGPTFERR